MKFAKDLLLFTFLAIQVFLFSGYVNPDVPRERAEAFVECFFHPESTPDTFSFFYSKKTATANASFIFSDVAPVFYDRWFSQKLKTAYISRRNRYLAFQNTLIFYPTKIPSASFEEDPANL